MASRPGARHLKALTLFSFLLVTLYLLLAGTGAPPAASRDARLDAIRHAKVWTATDVRAANVKAGPQGPFAFDDDTTVTCDFAPKPHGKGSTRKFECRLPSGRELKVRYGGTNGEVYAQVAATRLLWALGFGANRMYPVKVVCRGCPADPFKDQAPAIGARPVVFDPATIDVKLDGTTMETEPDQGWAWQELDLIDETVGGASRRERDALKLMAVLMQHSSNKAINQRVLCLDKPACRQSLMIMTDVGKTFGRANALNNDARGAVNFKEWSRTPIWHDTTGCVGNLAWSWSGTLHNPVIGEAGRAFLADLLNQLSDAQLRDLFEVARVTRRDPSATMAQWVDAFKHKRGEIAQRHCE